MTSHLERHLEKEEKSEAGWAGRKGSTLGIEGAFEDLGEGNTRRKREIIWIYGTTK